MGSFAAWELLSNDALQVSAAMAEAIKQATYEYGAASPSGHTPNFGRKQAKRAGPILKPAWPTVKPAWHPPNPRLAHVKAGGGRSKALLDRNQARVPRPPKCRPSRRNTLLMTGSLLVNHPPLWPMTVAVSSSVDSARIPSVKTGISRPQRLGLYGSLRGRGAPEPPIGPGLEIGPAGLG
ncbi:hypothetical protein PGTUg99_031835 [Puccinia graminis f. sp. tritici]|uniref:Uncharacterized protein n=1 Tax=Puccinia graminis f. sp. tritici TaxID=56615 RepID=A0A5B0RHN0_PUCGR|nr:hypothetical protein PGTUg99_031835 [Puccinia graminis f. sp. tritici]